MFLLAGTLLHNVDLVKGSRLVLAKLASHSLLSELRLFIILYKVLSILVERLIIIRRQATRCLGSFLLQDILLLVGHPPDHIIVSIHSTRTIRLLFQHLAQALLFLRLTPSRQLVSSVLVLSTCQTYLH